nr:DUF6233 domain-containing protein [Streptomyces sp. CB00455]
MAGLAAEAGRAGDQRAGGGAGRRAGPPAPASAAGLEARIHPDRIRTKALRVHVGDCAMSGGKPLGGEEARRMLAEGVEPCPYCSPENALGMTG